MRVIIVGLGVQGYKRRNFAGLDFMASVDPVNKEADYTKLEDVPLSKYDAALCCIPDGPKIEILTYLLKNNKNVLVEKPLWSEDEKQIEDLQNLAHSMNLVCYTAYNHRFEPHFVTMKQLIQSGELGDIYSCRMFYGNGTARLVRDSAWRDSGAGVLPDLGSHLLDIARFWFGELNDKFNIYASNCFENKSPDHVVFGMELNKPRLEFEVTLLSWRNHFTCDIFAEKGSAHITSLCKWGPSNLIRRKRILPSGKPLETIVTLIQDDPTWQLEYDHFKKLCSSGYKTDLSADIWLNRILRELGNAALLVVNN